MMSHLMKTELHETRDTVVASWLAARDTNLARGVGLVAYLAASDITSLLGADAAAAIARTDALSLPLLTEQSLTDTTLVKTMHHEVALARRDRRAILVATPLSEAALAGAASSTSHPSELDAAGLVARAELAFMIEQSCVARVMNGGRSALYLTPIEARLAMALRARNLTFQPQVEIGRFRADFLVQQHLCSVPGIVVECDGAGFHDEVRDASRDRELVALGYRVLRFSGSQIYRDAAACAAAVETAARSGAESSVRPPTVDTALSPRQAEAVAHRDGPARVAAPAGSGKTRVIAARVRRLVSDGIDPARICAVSFTNKAVGEMSERLPELADRATFTTLHSLAKRIAEGGGARRTLIQGIRPDHARSIPSRWAVLKPLLNAEEYKFRSSNDLWVEAVTTYRQAFSVPDFADWDPSTRPARQRFIEVCAAYDCELGERNLTDFEGWVHDAIRVLACDPARRALESAKFDYWIVDEYQDLPLAKLKLLRLLVAPARNVFVVGDDDQVLYGFAGASPEIFEAYSTEFPGAAEYVLDTNFRSRHELVVRTRWLIERNVRRVDKRTQAHHPLDDTDCVRVEVRSEYDELAESFVREHLAAGAAPDDIAVLFRLRDIAIPVERRLASAGVPHTRCSHDRFFERQSVRALLSWLMIVAGPREGLPLLLRDTLRWPPRYLRNETIDALVAVPVWDTAVELGDVIASLNVHRADLTVDHQGDALDGYIAALRNARAHTSPTTILDALGLRGQMKSESAAAGQASPVVVHDVLYRLAAQFKTVADLLRWIRKESGNPDYDFGADEEAHAVRGTVTLASIHQAKGLEWPHVAVVGPLDAMPDWRAATPGQLEEERRVAYVAATRAQQSLMFCASPQYARELLTRADGLTWADYRAGRTTPQPRVSPWPDYRTSPPTGRSRTRAATSEWDASIPEGASRRGGVWVLRVDVGENAGHACTCGLIAWNPPADASCPDCGKPFHVDD